MFEKNINKIDIQTVLVSLIVIFITFSRVIPHVYNFTPMIALAIFGSLHFKNRNLAYILPILSIPPANTNICFVIVYTLLI